MENTKQTPQEKSTLSNILEQIKIVLVIYGIVIIIHMVLLEANFRIWQSRQW